MADGRGSQLNVITAMLQVRDAVLGVYNSSIATNTAAIATSVGANIDTYLGTKLDDILEQLEANAVAQSGINWPLAPSGGTRFYNTTLRTWGTWDGTYWVGDAINYAIPLFQTQPFNGVAPTNLGALSLFAGEQYRLRAAYIALYVFAPNSGANFWTVSVTTPTGVEQAGWYTSGLSAGTWYNLSETPTLTLSTGLLLRVMAKTGNPGELYATAAVEVERLYDPVG